MPLRRLKLPVCWTMSRGYSSEPSRQQEDNRGCLSALSLLQKRWNFFFLSVKVSRWERVYAQPLHRTPKLCPVSLQGGSLGLLVPFICYLPWNGVWECVYAAGACLAASQMCPCAPRMGVRPVLHVHQYLWPLMGCGVGISYWVLTSCETQLVFGCGSRRRSTR